MSDTYKMEWDDAIREAMAGGMDVRQAQRHVAKQNPRLRAAMVAEANGDDVGADNAPIDASGRRPVKPYQSSMTRSDWARILGKTAVKELAAEGHKFAEDDPDNDYLDDDEIKEIEGDEEEETDTLDVDCEPTANTFSGGRTSGWRVREIIVGIGGR